MILYCRSNWLSSAKNPRAIFWRGRFNCIYESCKTDVEAFVKQGIECEKPVEIIVNVIHLQKHDKIEKLPRVIGLDRS
jgi:hypothetical protein